MAKRHLSDKERNEKLEGAHARLVEAVKELNSSESWTRYLKISARFHTYSVPNQILILSQRPEATRVAGFRVWQAMGRQVRKGAKGIAIFAPVIARGRTEDDEDANERRLRGFRLAYVFDISDTDGEALEDEAVRPVLLEGEAPEGMWEHLEAKIAAAGFELQLVEEIAGHGAANGITDYTTRVVQVATTGRSEASRARTLAHELAHALLHEDHKLARDVVEVEAESVAFLVADAFGLDASAYTIAYVANWGMRDPAAVLATAERVRRCATTILADLVKADSEEEAA